MCNLHPVASKKLWELAEEVFQPDENGWSREVSKSEMVSRYPQLQHKNGCSWGRSDGKLARKYELKRILKGREVKAYQLCGFRKLADFKSIRADIRRNIIGRPCVVTGVAQADAEGVRIECDHKNGRYDDPRLNEPPAQTTDDFQPLHRNVNLIKRSHCKRCKATGIRFDATVLGFGVAWTKGGPTRADEPDGCVGCYWHDVRDFHAKAGP